MPSRAVGAATGEGAGRCRREPVGAAPSQLQPVDRHSGSDRRVRPSTWRTAVRLARPTRMGGRGTLARESRTRGAVVMTKDQAAARAGIEELYALHHAEIFNYLSRMVRDDELAADLTQETFVKAYRAYDSLLEPSRARAWLYQIAGRTALDELRRRRIVRFVPWAGESRGTAASAEEVALHGRLSTDLERALAAIPQRQRMALLLAEVHELTGLELASALGVTHVAARALLTRARESLRQALAVERARSAISDAQGRERVAGHDGTRRPGRDR
jgi:RNA polymerase sigma factor (sigma-70 family)